MAASELRKYMVEHQIAGRGIRDERVLAAMGNVPREAFVPAKMAMRAYDDRPLPIEAGQTISQPYIVAHMIAAATIEPGDIALEIGAGSGYAAAVLSRIAERVYAIERHSELADLARERLHRLGYDNVEIREGDGTAGWPEAAPFDAILVAAGGPRIPEPLRDQLAIGGRLVMPVGGTASQKLVRLIRSAEDSFQEDHLGHVRFVPLIGSHGWGGERAADAPKVRQTKMGRS